jgi:phospholipid-translocating ATPase
MKKMCKRKKICAIGDGANDVSMLQKADVGVGIMGNEGNQASQFADFGVAQFQDLRRLAFWHGSLFGGRQTNFVNSILFKVFVI